jgi:hypothetical protein
MRVGFGEVVEAGKLNEIAAPARISRPGVHQGRPAGQPDDLVHVF